MKRWRSPWTALGAGLACFAAALLVGGHRVVFGSGRPVLAVRAVAHQWWWEFDYPSLGIETRDELHVPSNSVVRFALTSADVIHSFWMPGMKRAVTVTPGKSRIVDLKMPETGESYGTCDATCGCGAVCMRFQVFASSQRDFDRWAAHQHSIGGLPAPPYPAKAPPPCVSGARVGSAQS